MKKLLIFLLAALLVCTMLTGCGEVPSLEQFKGQSCEWALEKLEGYTEADLMEKWGDNLDGYAVPIWEIEEGQWYLMVEFDDNNVVRDVRVLNGESPDDLVYLKQNAILLGGKPVIYLYPEEETEVTVQVDIGKEFTSVYPAYDNGWKMIASPDGTLTDPDTGREYYCLFWEGYLPKEMDLSAGFCVKGSDTAAFLEDALKKLGLTDKEANEFIIYWLPQMEGNAYNLISFQKEAYTEQAKLTVTPTPDTVIRVFMAWEGLEEEIEIEPQELSAPEREGFTVVEWGAGKIGK